MISYDLWPSWLLGNYKITTSTKYRTKLLHEYIIYYHVSSRSWIVKYTTVPYSSVYSYANVPATYSSIHGINVQIWVHRNVSSQCIFIR
jgi:hypothetical protein